MDSRSPNLQVYPVFLTGEEKGSKVFLFFSVWIRGRAGLFRIFTRLNPDPLLGIIARAGAAGG